MGDGVLAIFPVSKNQSEAAVNALFAAQCAQNQTTDQIHFGIGLHIGNVHYGNVGSETRLDFTVLGTAVNTTARIEALCSETRRTVLMSQDFADLSQHPTESIGRFPLKGLTEPIEVFAPRSE